MNQEMVAVTQMVAAVILTTVAETTKRSCTLKLLKQGMAASYKAPKGQIPVDATYNSDRNTWQFPGNDAGPSTNYLTSPEITITPKL